MSGSVNDFMLSLITKLQSERGVSESSATAYIQNLYSLNDKKPFKNLMFLKKYDEIKERLSKYADSTQKTYLASIVSALSLMGTSKVYGTAYRYWREQMNDKVAEVAESTEEGEMTDKQKEAFISWEDVMKRQDELRQSASALQAKRSVSDKEYETLLMNVVLSLYTSLPPRRNLDYTNMFIVRKKADKTDDTSKNYLDLVNGRFIFNRYKTAKTHGQQIMVIPEVLMNDIKYYMKHHPQAKTSGALFLVHHDGSQLNPTNGMTRLLNKVFAPKKVASSMLRHIFLTQKFGAGSAAAEADADRAETAEAMAHTVGTQRSYVFSGAGEA